MNILLILLWACLLALYYPLNRRKECRYIKFNLDEKIPLIPIFVVPYLFLFVWMILPILALWQQEFLTPYLISQIVATLTGTIVWAIFPTGVVRPVLLENKNIFNRLLNKIYAHDGDVNACPSSHVFTSLISSYWLATFIPIYTIPIYLVGIAISLSTIFTKQHYYIDVIAGIIWAILSIIIGQYIWLYI